MAKGKKHTAEQMCEFAATDRRSLQAGAGINFNINLGGTVAQPVRFYGGGANFENAQWNHFRGQVSSFCKVGG